MTQIFSNVETFADQWSIDHEVPFKGEEWYAAFQFATNEKYRLLARAEKQIPSNAIRLEWL